MEDLQNLRSWYNHIYLRPIGWTIVNRPIDVVMFNLYILITINLENWLGKANVCIKIKQHIIDGNDNGLNPVYQVAYLLI